jgi:hypothetical protein
MKLQRPIFAQLSPFGRMMPPGLLCLGDVIGPADDFGLIVRDKQNLEYRYVYHDTEMGSVMSNYNF